MMNSGYGTPTYGANAMGYVTVETLLDDVSRQMAASNLARYSRGSNGTRASGSMRVVKPNSASNSPRGSIGLGRRRTVMTDRRRITITDPNTSTSGGFVSNDGLQNIPRSNRPVSWHPSSSQMAPQVVYHPTYAMSSLGTQNDCHILDLPPTPVVYSAYTSPASNFSPLSLPFPSYETQPQYPDSSILYPSNQGYAPSQLSDTLGQAASFYDSAQSGIMDGSMYSHFDWNNFAVHGFESPTAPPTPENFLPIQYPDGTLQVDEAIPYHSLSDSEPEGEILQGLGLYDSPETSKSLPADPQLVNYRALMMSQLFGPAYGRNEPESTGKGLKLEETWNPPASDDEDDEDDDELDGEGEDDEELAVEEAEHQSEPTTTYSTSKNDSTQVNHAFMSAASFLPNAHHGVQHVNSTSWV